MAARGGVRPALLLLCLPLINVAIAANVEGIVVDPTHAAIPNATVRLIAQSGGRMVYRTTTKSDGNFRIDDVEDARYMLAVDAPGFRERLIRYVQVREEAKVNAGAVVLDVTGCDTPGMSCDYFGAHAPPEPLAKGDFHATIGCALDLDGPNRGCTAADKRADLAVRQGEDGRIFLEPLNGSSLAEPDSVYDCRRAAYSDAPAQIEGLGPGSDICIRTRKKRYAHLFFTAEVWPSANGISFHYVVRK